MINKSLLDDSKKYAELILKDLDGRTIKKDSLRELIVTAFLSLSQEHYNSIVILLEKKIYSSAFALLRPLIDAVYRGLWASEVANEKEIEKIFNTEYKFESQTYKYIKEIDKCNNTKVFHNRYKEMSSFLHGMTHGGIEQLTRQFSKDGDFIQPNFTKKDLENLINNINSHIAIFLIDYNRYQTDNKLGILGHKMLNIKKEDILYDTFATSTKKRTVS